MIETEFVEGFDFPDAVITAWESLVLESDRPEVFLTPGWARACVEAFSAGDAVFVLVHDQSALRAVAALRRDASDSQTVHFLADRTADYCDIVSRPHDRGVAVDAMLKVLRNAGFRRVVLHAIPSTSPTIPALKSHARGHGFVTPFVRNGQQCPVIELPDRASDRDALCADIGVRKSIRRHRKALERSGRLTVQHLETTDELLGALDPFFAAQIVRFLATGRRSPFLDLERRHFVRQLIERIGPQRRVVMSRLLLDETPVAWNFGFVYAGKWFWYQPTLNQDYAQLWPGEVLLAEIVAAAVDRQDIQAVDLGIGTEFYKSRFATDVIDTRSVLLDRSPAGAARDRVRALVAARATQDDRVGHVLKSSIDTARKVASRPPKANAAIALGRLIHTDRLRFYRWDTDLDIRDLHSSRDAAIAPIGRDAIANLALAYPNDPDILAHLERGATRLQSGTSGYALYSQTGDILHWLWTAPSRDFAIAELRGAQLPGDRLEGTLIFDCWTPPRHRGRGWYHMALDQTANLLIERVSAPVWIFCSLHNVSSAIGISKSSARAAFEVGVTVRLGRTTVTRLTLGPELRRTTGCWHAVNPPC